MKKILALLLLSPLAITEPSDDTQKFLWNDKVSLLTFGLYRCEQYLQEEKNSSWADYLKDVDASCSFSYPQDKIMLIVTVADLRSLYDSWTEESFITEVYKTGDMSLDKVLQGCQKVVNDFDALEYTLSDVDILHPFVDYFSNQGLIIAGTQDEHREHVKNMFKIIIRLKTTSLQQGMKGYTCEIDAEDKKYKLGTGFDEYNFSITKEDEPEYYKRLRS